jgi:hypothetical protein
MKNIMLKYNFSQTFNYCFNRNYTDNKYNLKYKVYQQQPP